MPFLDFGFGTGLAYKHDFQSQDNFKLNLLELADRKKAREEEQLRLQREEDRQILSEKERQAEARSKYLIGNTIQGDAYNTARLTESQKGSLAELGALTSDPGFLSNPEAIAKAETMRAEMLNDPIIAEAAAAKADYDRAKKDHDENRLSTEEFHKVEQEYLDYRNQKYQPGTTGKTFKYESTSVDLNEMLRNNLEGITPPEGFYGSKKEDALAFEVYGQDPVMKKAFDDTWNSLPDEVKAKDGTFQGDKMAWVRQKIRLQLGQEQSLHNQTKTTTPDDGLTPTERTARETLVKAQNAYINIIRGEDSGSDQYLGDLAAVDKDGFVSSTQYYVLGKDGKTWYLVDNSSIDGGLAVDRNKMRNWETVYPEIDNNPNMAEQDKIKAKNANPGDKIAKSSGMVQPWNSTEPDAIEELRAKGLIEYRMDNQGNRILTVGVPLEFDGARLTKWYENSTISRNVNNIQVAAEEETPQKED